MPGQRIAWRSVGSADIYNEGSVRFVQAPGGRGTEVHVKLRYEIPGGKLGEAVTRYFGEDPRQQLDDDLRRFKQVAETGEVVRSEGAPGGKRAQADDGRCVVVFFFFPGRVSAYCWPPPARSRARSRRR